MKSNLSPRRLGAVVFVTAVLALAWSCSGRSPASNVRGSVDDEAGRFLWQDLVTDDVDGSRQFYGSLLGWQFEETTSLGRRYVLARHGDDYVAGIVGADRESPDEPIAQWVSYIVVPDLNGAIAKVAGAGGETLAGPHSIRADVRSVIVADPQGAALGLISLETMPEEPSQPIMNGFFWREYLAKDAESALTFYKNLAGYDSEMTESRNGIHYHVLRRGRTRAGVMKLPDTPVEPNWLPYVRVEDPKTLAERATALGGTVILEPRADIRNGSLAIVADPSGAAVALQKWPF